MDIISFALPLLEKYTKHNNSIQLFALCFTRMMMIIAFVPFLGSKNAPGPAKVTLGVAFTLLLWPAITHGQIAHSLDQPVIFAGLLIKEAFVGLIIGLVTAEMFFIVEIAGQLADMFRGANQIQAMVPELSDRSSALGTLNYQLLLCLFMGMHHHAFFFQALMDSFKAVPVNQFPAFSFGSFALFKEMAAFLSMIFRVGVTLAMPVAIVCLIIDIAFGMLNRVAPQINAYFISMPAKILAGMVIFFAAFTLAIEQYTHRSYAVLQELKHMIWLFR